MYLSAEQIKVNNHVAVLPCGYFPDGSFQDWKPGVMRYYCSFVRKGKSVDRMFGGLVFQPVAMRPRKYIHPMYIAFGDCAQQEDWESYIAMLFAGKRCLGAAGSVSYDRLDIWITLPYPARQQKLFGKIKGKKINFENPQDRAVALKWWLNRFIEQWEKEKVNFPKLTLRGFAWQREVILDDDIPLVKEVNRLVHRRRLLSLWLPNYGSNHVTGWKSLGFDAVCINPNYYGNTHHDVRWVNYAAAFARTYGTGLQINYGRGIIYNKTHLADYLNLGLPAHNGYIKNCFTVYRFAGVRLDEAGRRGAESYLWLYRFIKGTYTKKAYRGISY